MAYVLRTMAWWHGVLINVRETDDINGDHFHINGIDWGFLLIDIVWYIVFCLR